jgi:hypothetical protein
MRSGVKSGKVRLCRMVAFSRGRTLDEGNNIETVIRLYLAETQVLKTADFYGSTQRIGIYKYHCRLLRRPLSLQALIILLIR